MRENVCWARSLLFAWAMKKLTCTLLLASTLGCGARIDSGESGSGNDRLGAVDGGVDDTVEPDSEPAKIAPADSGDGGDDPIAVDAAPPPPIAVEEIAYIEVDEIAPIARKIRVTATCRVTDHRGLDAMGDPTRCKELLEISIDMTPMSCGPYGGSGTVRIHTHDGRDYVRDLSADRCSVAVPSLWTHKYTYAVWYSAGGRN